MKIYNTTLMSNFFKLIFITFFSFFLLSDLIIKAQDTLLFQIEAQYRRGISGDYGVSPNHKFVSGGGINLFFKKQKKSNIYLSTGIHYAQHYTGIESSKEKTTFHTLLIPLGIKIKRKILDYSIYCYGRSIVFESQTKYYKYNAGILLNIGKFIKINSKTGISIQAYYLSNLTPSFNKFQESNLFHATNYGLSLGFYRNLTLK